VPQMALQNIVVLESRSPHASTDLTRAARVRFSRPRRDTKSDALRGMIDEVAISSRRSFVNGVAVETSTASDAPVATRLSLRVNRRLAGIGPEPVLAPLPYVPQDVVKTECVRQFLSHGTSRARPISAIPGNVVQRSISFPRTSGSSRVFPFRLGG